MNKILFALHIFFLFAFSTYAQSDRWQQRVEYKMEIDVDAVANQFSGVQELKYFNNSPDTLKQVFYHLYFNAFQLGSMMDVRSRTLPDPDRRVKSRIFNLQEDEIGYHKINSLTQGGKVLAYTIDGTIMTVKLDQPILPNSSVIFKMTFESQIPLQVRRSGRDNKEGIRLSVSQWYPKMAEYDYSGWHTHDYIAREFYSPWGDFDVTINIDSDYMVAAGGVLQNPEEIGKGYAKSKNKEKVASYHFEAKNVHDFVWAADPDYVHKIVNVREGLDFHLFYQTDTLKKNWVELEDYIKRLVPFIEERCGAYPYPIYSVIQGGDGGMEYPMATLIKGHRSVKGLVGVTVHELLHSWYQMILGTNESYLYWMDEGFTSYYSSEAMDFLFNENYPSSTLYESSNKYYRHIVEKGIEEPLTTHADHFNSNRAYGMAAYAKGALALNQLSYILGAETFDRAMLRYYDEWKFKHPNATDFEVIMEKESGLQLSWFFDYWVGTTKTIDYGVKNVTKLEKGTKIELEKIGKMPMPLNLSVVLKNGEKKKYYIPIGMMRGIRSLKENEVLMTNWKWVNPFYSFEIDVEMDDILRVEIDPDHQTSDIDLKNNSFPNSNNEVEIIGKPQELSNIN